MHDELPQDTAEDHQRPRCETGRDADRQEGRLTVPSRRSLLAGATVIVGAGSLVGNANPAQAQGSTGERRGKFADPQPTLDNPRKIIISLAEDDPRRINAVLSNIVNIQKYYDAAQVRLAVIAYGPGIVAVLKDRSPVVQRIESLQALDVEFIACGATLETLHKTKADLLADVDEVPNGLPEIVERSLSGWVHLHP